MKFNTKAQYFLFTLMVILNLLRNTYSLSSTELVYFRADSPIEHTQFISENPKESSLSITNTELKKDEGDVLYFHLFPLNLNDFLKWYISYTYQPHSKIMEEVIETFQSTPTTPQALKIPMKLKHTILEYQKGKLRAFLNIQKKKSHLALSQVSYYNIFLREFFHPIVENNLSTLPIDDLSDLLLINSLIKNFESTFSSLSPSCCFPPHIQRKIISSIEHNDVTQCSSFSLFKLFKISLEEKIFSNRISNNIKKTLKKHLQKNPLNFKLKEISVILSKKCISKKLLISAAEKIITKDIQTFSENKRKPGFFDNLFQYVYAFPLRLEKELMETLILLICKSELSPIIEKFEAIPDSLGICLRQCKSDKKLYWFSRYIEDVPTKLEYTNLLYKYFHLYEKVSQNEEMTGKWSLLFESDKNISIEHEENRLNSNSLIFLSFLQKTPFSKISQFLQLLKKTPSCYYLRFFPCPLRGTDKLEIEGSE